MGHSLLNRHPVLNFDCRVLNHWKVSAEWKTGGIRFELQRTTRLGLRVPLGFFLLPLLVLLVLLRLPLHLLQEVAIKGSRRKRSRDCQSAPAVGVAVVMMLQAIGLVASSFETSCAVLCRIS